MKSERRPTLDESLNYRQGVGVAVRLWHQNQQSGKTECLLIQLPPEDYFPFAKTERAKANGSWGEEKLLKASMSSFVSGAVDEPAQPSSYDRPADYNGALKATLQMELEQELGIRLESQDWGDIYGFESSGQRAASNQERLKVRQLRPNSEELEPVEFEVVVGDWWLDEEGVKRLKNKLGKRLQVVELRQAPDLAELRPLAQAMLYF